MTSSIEIFGKDIKLKTHTCGLLDEPGIEIDDPYVNLYIRTKFCDSKCQFCTYADDASKYNEKRYIEVLKEITSKIKIRKIAVSGGEPTLYWENFKNITYIAKEYTPYSEFSMNTDGLRLLQLFNDPIQNVFDFIQISRHHWGDSLNGEIFGTKGTKTEEIKEAVRLSKNDHQIQFRCNLIKGYVDNKEKMFQFLDWSNEIGVNDIGLVSLMPVNQYSKDNYIYFHIKELIGDNFFLTKKWQRHGGGCECFNYVYMPKEENFRRPIRVYHKNTFKPSDMKETLVFDGQNLRIGFDGEIIY